MRTFTIDSDDNISVFSSAEEAGETAGLERFHSAEQLASLAEHWRANRLVEIWNSSGGRTDSPPICPPTIAFIVLTSGDRP
jgi:hypothetical protein